MAVTTARGIHPVQHIQNRQDCLAAYLAIVMCATYGLPLLLPNLPERYEFRLRISPSIRGLNNKLYHPNLPTRTVAFPIVDVGRLQSDTCVPVSPAFWLSFL